MALQPLYPIRILKRSLQSFLHRKKCLRRRPHSIISYLAANKTRKLQIGAYENRLNNWLNTDLWPKTPHLIHLDATTKFPFDDSTFDYIFSEHVIEHLTYQNGLFMLKECFRVLRPGGKIRIATPDLDQFLSLFKTDLNHDQLSYTNWVVQSFVPYAPKADPIFVLNNLFRNWGHEFIYNKEALKSSFQEAGFHKLQFFNVGESDDPHLKDIEVHGKIAMNEQTNAYETMVLQAQKFII